MTPIYFKLNISKTVQDDGNMLTQQRGEGQSAQVTHVHGLYHVTNADVGGLEYADVGLHGESGGYADSAVWGRVTQPVKSD